MCINWRCIPSSLEENSIFKPIRKARTKNNDLLWLSLTIQSTTAKIVPSPSHADTFLPKANPDVQLNCQQSTNEQQYSLLLQKLKSQ